MSVSDWHPDGLDAFFNSRYDYADAALLAKLWNIPVVEAKQAIGHKIIHGIEDLLPAEVAPDPKFPDPKSDDKLSADDSKWLDTFFASPYNYYDAELLAQLWNLGTVEEAKILIGAKILNGNENILPDKVRAGSKASPDEGTKMLDKFFGSTYTYEDAALLAQLWNIDLVEAKKTIGYKLFAGLERLLPDKIRHTTGHSTD